MSEFYRAKFNVLFAEFTCRLIEHPEFTGQIPDCAEVMLLDSHDTKNSRNMLNAIRAAPPEHPVVYIEVGELAPVLSRLRNPRVIQTPAARAMTQQAGTDNRAFQVKSQVANPCPGGTPDASPAGSQ